VYIGSYCIVGKAVIGERAQIASGVQILSGSRQHARNSAGEISGAEEGGVYHRHHRSRLLDRRGGCCDGGRRAGNYHRAGSVVTRPIPDRSVAVGSPAQVVRAAASRDTI